MAFNFQGTDLKNAPPANGNLKRHSSAITRPPRPAPPPAPCSRRSASTTTSCAAPSSASPTPGLKSGSCNFHLRHLAEEVEKGIYAAGGTPMEFNTVSISDGITMGTEGMRASLVSREVIANSSTGRPRQSLRRPRRPRRLRQDHSRRRHGAADVDVPGLSSTAAPSIQAPSRATTSPSRTSSKQSPRTPAV